MKIALIAHDSKKELMVQFCIAYRGILSKHALCATEVTGTTISEATGLNIKKFMAGGQGGAEQIVARVACNEIDLVLLFRDHIAQPGYNQIEANLLRLCDTQNIPVATNIATAEVLIHGLERGDLDWRNIVNPNSSEDYT
ncbi:MAG: methylglyoxal synthase [Oscillospiraceae bacterium]|nr:methylglyoxal synthase [Oscillospiraceae bacterium]